MSYPSATMEAAVARCYVCDEVVSKHRMIMVGADKENEGKYIYRCDDCYVGSDKWLKHYLHKSSVRAYFKGFEAKKMDSDLMKAVGSKIVEKTKEKHEREIVARLDSREVKEERGSSAPKESRGRNELSTKEQDSGSPALEEIKGGLNGRKRKSWRTASFRRAR